MSAWRDRLYTGDMRHVVPHIPEETVDLVVSDPPYNIGFRYDEYHDALSQEEYIEMLRLLRRFPRIVLIHYPEDMFRLVAPALGYPDHVGAWCYDSNIPRRMRLIGYWGFMPDYKRSPRPYSPRNPQQNKRMYAIGHEGAAQKEWWDDIPRPTNNLPGPHPCPVPLELMRRIIRISSLPGDLVYDPFMGQGTTALAAHREGRHYLGTEISRRYTDYAQELLRVG